MLEINRRYRLRFLFENIFYAVIARPQMLLKIF